MRPIPNFEEYSVTTDGKVFSHKWGKTRELKKYINEKGYYKVWLYNSDKKRKMMLVHRAVLLAYVDNPENKPLVNHIDGNIRNNNLNNLEWSTEKENDEHARKHGLKGKRYVLTNETIREIKLMQSQGFSTRQTGKILGINYRTVWEGTKL